MIKIITFVAAMTFALTGCGPSTQPPTAAGPDAPAVDSGDLRAVQNLVRPEITPERIMTDIVGRVVQVSELTGTWPPTEWTFDAGEFRQAEILSKHETETEYTVVIFMTTRSNPEPDEDDIQVSGRLQLHYEWKGGQWTLTNIENLSFRYSVGQST